MVGAHFHRGMGACDVLEVTTVDPQLVVEVAVDVARDRARTDGATPVRLHRAGLDLSPDAVPLFGT